VALTSRLGLRRGFARFSRALIVYGIVGLIVSAIGVAALVWVNDRVGVLRADVEATQLQQAAILDLAAGAIRDAGTTAGSFTVTLDQSSHAVSSAADTIVEVHSGLAVLETELRSVNILGTKPLSASADGVGRIAASMEGLDLRLSLIADSLVGDRLALASNAASLRKLGDVTQSLATQLRSGTIDDSLGDLQRLISLTLLVFSAWSAVPAVGALMLGVWLRRELGRSRSR
jgi:hypothetical protein